MKILVNCAIVKDMFGDKCLFGEIYNDDRYEDGHHLLTSKIESLKNMTATTRSGTVYQIYNLMSKEDIVEIIELTYTDQNYIKYLKSFIK